MQKKDMQDINMQDIYKKRWLSPLELEKEFGIKESTQAQMRMKGKIPFSKIGKFIRYDRYEIDKWLENHKVVKNN